MYFYYEPSRLTLSFFSTIAAYTTVSDPELDALADAINQETDKDKRTELGAQLTTLLTDKLWGSGLVVVSSLAVTGENVASWTTIKGCPYAVGRLAAGEVAGSCCATPSSGWPRPILVLWVVVTVVFLLSRASGNIAELMAPPDAPPETVALIEENLGLDDPLIVQYGRYLGDLVQGDLGESFAYRAPVDDLIREALPKSIELGLAAFAFAVIFGIPIGVLSATRPGGWFDRMRQGRRAGRAVGAELLARHPARPAVLGAPRLVPGVRLRLVEDTSSSRRSPSAGTRWPRSPGSPDRP